MNAPVNIDGIQFSTEMFDTLREWHLCNAAEEAVEEIEHICEALLLNWDGVDDYIDVKETLLFLSGLKAQLKTFIPPQKDAL